MNGFFVNVEVYARLAEYEILFCRVIAFVLGVLFTFLLFMIIGSMLFFFFFFFRRVLHVFVFYCWTGCLI